MYLEHVESRFLCNDDNLFTELKEWESGSPESKYADIPDKIKS
jgi:hypothetical protein